MKLTKISIQNFRGVKDKQEIPISGFSSIVGKNDSGKSIVVNAIASFLDPKTYKIVESDFNDTTKEIILEASFSDGNLKEVLKNKIKIKIKKDDGMEEFLENIILEDKVAIQKIAIKAGSDFKISNILMKDYINDDFKSIYSKSDEELETVLTKYSIIIPVSGVGRNSKLEKIKHIKEYCKTNSIQQINVWIEDVYKICDLLPAVELFVSDYGLEADTKFKTNSVSEIKNFFETETSDETKRLSKIEKDIQKEMNKEAESIKKFMCDYTPSLQEVVITPDISWAKAIDDVNVKFKFDGDSDPIIMSHKGAGYRRLFMVARFRYLAEKNRVSNIVYLIEEPETFLHPSAQQDLLEALQRLSEENQVVITTHSPIFAGSTEGKSIILCLKDKQSVYEVAKDDNMDQFIHKIIEELGIKPHHNLRDNFAKIVFVEGKDDIYFYDKLSQVLLKKNLKNNSDILLLPFGGSSVNSFINIEYFSKQNRPMFLFLDSDKGLKNKNPEKIRVQKNIFDEFNKKPDSKAYLLKKSAIENYFHPKAVERFLSLPKDTIRVFTEDDCMDDVIKEINTTHGKNFSKKSNIKIFEEMTEQEFKESIEIELNEFLSLIYQ